MGGAQVAEGCRRTLGSNTPDVSEVVWTAVGWRGPPFDVPPAEERALGTRSGTVVSS